MRKQLPRYVQLTDPSLAIKYEDPISLSVLYQPITVKDSEPPHTFSAPIIDELTRTSKLDPMDETTLASDWRVEDYKLDMEISKAIGYIPLTNGGINMYIQTNKVFAIPAAKSVCLYFRSAVLCNLEEGAGEKRDVTRVTFPQLQLNWGSFFIGKSKEMKLSDLGSALNTCSLRHKVPVSLCQRWISMSLETKYRGYFALVSLLLTQRSVVLGGDAKYSIFQEYKFDTNACVSHTLKVSAVFDTNVWVSHTHCK